MIIIFGLAVGCTPVMRVDFEPRVLNVNVDSGEIYNSDVRIDFQGVGCLYVKDTIVDIEIMGDKIPSTIADIGEFVGLFVGFTRVGEKRFQYVKKIDRDVPVFFNFGKTFAEKEMAENYSIDTSDFKKDIFKKLILVEMIEGLRVNLLLRDQDKMPLAITNLEINFEYGK
jgi:hypothetical protein